MVKLLYVLACILLTLCDITLFVRGSHKMSLSSARNGILLFANVAFSVALFVGRGVSVWLILTILSSAIGLSLGIVLVVTRPRP